MPTQQTRAGTPEAKPNTCDLKAGRSEEAPAAWCFLDIKKFKNVPVCDRNHAEP